MRPSATPWPSAAACSTRAESLNPGPARTMALASLRVAACVTCNSSTARVKLWWRATASKARRAFSGAGDGPWLNQNCSSKV
jgi:hypothetical protein